MSSDLSWKQKTKKLISKLKGRREDKPFIGSGKYWENRYARGGNSGAGSYGRLATFKAETLNRFVEEKQIQSVIEFGSGDGHQLTLAKYPSYLGYDVSDTAVAACRKMFVNDATKTFKNLSEYTGEVADLSLSLDVIYHLIEDTVFENYMSTLFDAAGRYVVIYASNRDETVSAKHVRHRMFSRWVEAERKDFRLSELIENIYPFDANDPHNTSFADFYFFERMSGP